MIHVVATVQVKPGKREEFLKHFRAIVSTVLFEKGCKKYGPTVDLPAGLPRQVDPRPDTVVIVEEWDTLDDLKAHLAAPHMATYREKVKDLVVSAQLQVLQDA
jgi:quinol monooxygenase YgiN